MTPTTSATVRVSPDRDCKRNIVVIVGPGSLLGFRLKGTRKVFETTIHAAYSMAVKQEVAARKAAKAAARKLKKGGF